MQLTGRSCLLDRQRSPAADPQCSADDSEVEVLERLGRVRPLAIASCIALAACATASGVRTIGGAPGYSIRYVSAAPKPGTTLAAGQNVTLTLTVAYRLEVAEKGRVVAVLQREDNSPLLPGRKQASVEVVKGSGQTTLSDEFEVPHGTRTVKLFVPLVPSGFTHTSGELLIEYPVR